MIVELVPLVVVSNAPELASVPQEFWQALRQFIIHGKTGHVTWHFNAGQAEKMEATEHVRRARTRELTSRSA